MNRQYSLVNECLKLLRDKDINTTQKLRVEIQLSQLKRLLLSCDMDEAAGDAFMVSLLAVCRNISQMDGGESFAAAFDEVTTGLQRIIDDLAGGRGSNGGGGCMYI